MKKTFCLLLLAASVFLTSCGTLLPKKVELFQDKVKKFPEISYAQKEVQRQAAQRAKEKASETLVAAVAEKASPFVISPATETVVLTDVVADVVGPPAKRPTIDTVALADEVRKTLATQAKKVDSFKEDSNENAGKKIEGTGLVQVPYFAWLGGVLVIVFVLWHLAKLALTAASAANPGALVGVGAMNVASSTASRGLVQIVNGGKRFVEWANKTVEDPALRQNILDAFVDSHKRAQDEDVKAVVDRLLK
jgi:hypothetical protein